MDTFNRRRSLLPSPLSGGKTPPTSVSSISLASRRESQSSSDCIRKKYPARCALCQGISLTGAETCSELCGEACGEVGGLCNFICTHCNRMAMDEQLLKPIPFSMGIPLTPPLQMIPDTLAQPTFNMFKNEQTINNDDTFSEEIFRPQISISSDIEHITTPNLEVTYMVNVKSPEIYSKPEITVEESQTLANVRRIILQRLSNILIAYELNQQEFGTLVTFDYFQLTNKYFVEEQVCCYYFEYVILVVAEELLMAQIVVENDVTKVTKSRDTLSINLDHTCVPDMQLKFTNYAVILKWHTLLSKLIKGSLNSNDITMFQITTNAWNVVEDQMILPEEISEFSSIISNGCKIPTAYLTEALVLPDYLPLNLIVSVLVVNCTSMSDVEYKSGVTTLLGRIRDSLRPIDKLGLVFVGIDGRGVAGRNGKFIGCVESSWVGWDKIIEEIRVTPNQGRSKTIFHHELQQQKISFEKCMDLFPFIPSSPESINKFIVLSVGEFEDQISADTHERMTQVLNRMVDSLVDRLSITIIRIGSEYNCGVKEVQRIISRPNNGCKISYGPTLLRYDSFHSFNLVLETLIRTYQNICIPSIKISIDIPEESALMAKVSAVEVNGMFQTVKNNKLCLIIKDIVPNTERGVMLKIRVGIEDGGLKNLNVLSFQSSWLRETTLEERVCANIGPGKHPSMTTPISDYLKGLNLLFPDSGPDQSFSRRQSELDIIRTLKMANTCDSLLGQDMMLQSVSLVCGLIPDLGGGGLRAPSHHSGELFAPVPMYHNSHSYVQSLVEELSTIKDLFASNTKKAAIKCDDLAIRLM